MAQSLPFPGAARHILLGLCLLAMIPAALFVQRPAETDARVVWCAGDPTIIVNGSPVAVLAHMPLDRLDDIDHVEFVFHVPSNADVTTVINDSVFFRVKIRVVKDLPRTRWWEVLNGTPVNVDINVAHRGRDFDYRATTVSLFRGLNLWQYAESDESLTIRTRSLVSLNTGGLLDLGGRGGLLDLSGGDDGGLLFGLF